MEQYQHAKILLGWDFDNGQVSPSVDMIHVFDRILRVLRTNGYMGVIDKVLVYGASYLEDSIMDVFTEKGWIIYEKVSPGKDATDFKLIDRLMHWVGKYLHAPANIMLIGRDRDFSNLMHRLRMTGYNILVSFHFGNSTPDPMKMPLLTAASDHWDMKPLARNYADVHDMWQLSLITLKARLGEDDEIVVTIPVRVRIPREVHCYEE